MTGDLEMKGSAIIFRSAQGNTTGLIEANKTNNEILYYSDNATHTFMSDYESSVASFIGDVKIGGTLLKKVAGFQIDHPLDPENKYLLHSTVESSEMLNIYNGNVILDNNGEAEVHLPEWFEALNEDFRYQLTCIGAFAPVYISQEIAGNSFRIAGGNLGMKVSWQVSGTRKDEYANSHRIQVEVDKQ